MSLKFSVRDLHCSRRNYLTVDYSRRAAKATAHVKMLQAPNRCDHLLVQRLDFASSPRSGTRWVL